MALIMVIYKGYELTIYLIKHSQGMLHLQCWSRGWYSLNAGAVEASVAMLEPLKLQLQCWSRWYYLQLHCWSCWCPSTFTMLEYCMYVANTGAVECWYSWKAGAMLQHQCMSYWYITAAMQDQCMPQHQCWRAVDTTVEMLESSGYNSWYAGEQWMKCRRAVDTTVEMQEMFMLNTWNPVEQWMLQCSCYAGAGDATASML